LQIAKAAASKYEIVVVPTIIVFKDGKEIKRYQADISFKITATKNDIQELVDESIMSGF
jgi:thioredoxin-like negative regulator of GroEL